MRRNIWKEILIRDEKLSLDLVTKKDNRSNKQYLYKPEDFHASVRGEIYMGIRTLGIDENFMTSRLTKNVRKKLFSYFLHVRSPQRLHICIYSKRGIVPNFCRLARSRTQKQVVGHENRDNERYVRRTFN